MNDTITDPGASETPAPDVDNPEVTTPETAESNETESDPLKALEARLEKERSRMERRINRKHAEAATANERVRELEARLSQYDQPKEEADSAPVDIDKLANERAAEMLTVKQVETRSNEVFAAGVKVYGDKFQEAVATVIDEAGPLIQRNGKPTPLGEAILDADKPAELLHHLSQNPDLADQLRGLSPAQIGRRVAKIEADIAKTEPKRSNAPAPLTPVRAASSKSDPQPGSSDYIAWKMARINGN